MVMTITEIVNDLIKAHHEKEDVNLNRLKSKISSKYGLFSQPRLVDIIAAVPQQHKKVLLPKLKAKPVRTASGIAVVAVMCKPHRCPHIAMTGNICVYCPGGPDSDFEYSTQSYTGYEPTSMRAIRARYNPYLQTRHRVEQLKQLGHSVDKVEFIVMGGTFMCLSEEYRDCFIRNLHDALSGHTSCCIEEAVKYSEKSKTKCIGITIETRPDYCLKKHLSDMLKYGCTRLEIGVQSVYEDVARDTNRGHTVRAVSESFLMSKDAGFKVVSHMMPDLPNVDLERDIEQFVEVKPSKRKRFPIGQWARDQKLKTVKEASNTRAEQLQSDIYRKEERISELNAHIEWLERLEVDKNANITPKIMRDKQVQVCSNSANQLLVDQENGQIPGKQKTPTHLSPANPDQCMMSRSTTSARMKETTKAMKLIHGNNIKNVKDATWLSLVKLCTPNELNDYIQRSKSCKTALFKKGKVKKRKKIQERNARKNVVRCVETLYKGGMISSRKYNSIRCSNLGHSEPESLTYKELKQELDAIMEETRTQPVEGCGGVYRDFETTLLKLAEIYLKIDGVLVEQSGSGLNWFGKNRGNFAIAIGADGAPSGKHNTKTSLLLSFATPLTRCPVVITTISFLVQILPRMIPFSFHI
ncbi:uncharacterized protein LOC135485889 isoform X2 [Lineus longissimus]